MRNEPQRTVTKEAGGPRWVLGLLAILYLASPALSSRVNPSNYTGGRLRDAAERQQRNTSAVGLMLGEFRTSISDLLYIKTDRYYHAGVAYYPHTHGETMSVSGAEKAAFEHQKQVEKKGGGKEHHIVPTLIRTPKNDFRGFIGDLQRTVKPWIPPAKEHHLTDGTELLPWFRLMTLSDPHYIRGYAIGGWWLKRKNPEEAMRFIDEGLKNNPRSFQIEYMKGQLLFDRARAQAKAQLYNPPPELKHDFLEAGAHYRKAAELALAERPPGGKAGNRTGRWTGYKESDCLAAVHMAVMMEKTYGSRKDALALARRYHAKLKNDKILERLIDRLQQENDS